MVTITITDIHQEYEEDANEPTAYIVEYAVPEYSGTFKTEPISAEDYDREAAKDAVKSSASALLAEATINVRFPNEADTGGEDSIDRRRTLKYGAGLLATAGLFGGGGWVLGVGGSMIGGSRTMNSTRPPTPTATPTPKDESTPTEEPTGSTGEVTTPRNADPVAAYTFEEDGETVVDQTGNGHSGELVRAERVSGRDGTVIGFEKSRESYIQIGTADTLDPHDESYSASLWFNATEVTGGNETLLAKRGSDNERFRITIGQTESGDGRVQFFLKDDPGMGNSGVRPSETYTDGEWHRVTAVRDTNAQELRLYVDGERIGTATDEQNNVDPDAPLYLGAQPEYPNPRYYTGKIDDVRIYTEAIDQ